MSIIAASAILAIKAPWLLRGCLVCLYRFDIRYFLSGVFSSFWVLLCGCFVACVESFYYLVGYVECGVVDEYRRGHVGAEYCVEFLFGVEVNEVVVY